MIQEILTYLIVAWAFFKVFVFFYRIFKPVQGGSACGSGGGCPSCDTKTDLFNEIKKGRFPTLLEEK